MRHRKLTQGYPPLYALSTLLFVLALAGVAVLVATDYIHHLRVTLLHQRLDAWPLIAVGLSYITLNFAKHHKRSEQVKGIFLGVAFLLWGGEQLLPSSRLVTFMDEGAVSIFVIDLSIIIWGHLNTSEVTTEL